MVDISEPRPMEQSEEPAASPCETVCEEEQEEKKAEKERFSVRRLNWKKLNISAYILLGCIGLMFLCVLLSLAAPEHTLLNDAFDAFKMIALVVLGYIFGTNSINQQPS